MRNGREDPLAATPCRLEAELANGPTCMGRRGGLVFRACADQKTKTDRMPRPKTKAATHAGTKDQKAHRPRGTRTDRQTKGQYHIQTEAPQAHPKKGPSKTP